jgi:hypothetical protein
LIQPRHLAPRPPGLFALALASVLAAALAGCSHKPVRSPLPVGVLAPVDLETPAPPDSPPMIATLPPPELGPLPAPEPPPPAPRRRPAPPPKETTPPAPQVATNDATAALAIGALSTGGQDASNTQQQAQDLIGSVRRRIAALPPKTANAQKKEIRQIGNFLDQAEQALKSGDAEGANTLATKAKLLMDDVEKK